MLGYNGGFWEEWINPHKVTFDGPNKLILINVGVTSLDVKQDIYSDWKEWSQYYTNLQYLPAIRVVGGDTISDTKAVGSSFFLQNGWQIKPYVGNYDLAVDGNLYTDNEDKVIFAAPDEASSIGISLQTSNLTDVVIIDNTTPLDTTAPTWDNSIGIIDAYQSGNLINIRWGHAVDTSGEVQYNIYISNIEGVTFNFKLGSFNGNLATIGTEYDGITQLTTGTYYIGVRAIDKHGNETTNTNTATIGFIEDISANGGLTTAQENALYDIQNKVNNINNEQFGLTNEQHEQLMKLVNYNDTSLKNLAYAILGSF